MRDRFTALFSKFRSKILSLFSRPETRYTVWAVLTVTLAEVLNMGVDVGVTYIFRRPVSFLCAVLIVYLSYTLTFLVKRRIGVFLLVECFWIGIAIANRVLLGYRVNPLSAVDFSIIFSVFSIINVYLSPLQIFLIIVAIVAAVALAVFAMFRLPKEKTNYKSAGFRVLFTAALTIVCFFCSTVMYSEGFEELNLPEVYREYGFVYSFSLTCVDRGIDRPDEYSRVNISNMLSKEDETDSADAIPESTVPSGEPAETPSAETGTQTSAEPSAETSPNVIFVQLESFFDPEQIIGLKTSADAIPNFRTLKESCPSGQLTVPVAGAGTVNTEFEVLCGIPISVFGLGEYPYETVLTDSPCESLAYYLRESGYTCHAIHNHTGTFYDRYTVMQNLGFDTFTPVEYMSGVRRNSLGWAKDGILTDEIVGAITSTDGGDFVYAVSVQAHGKYVSVDGEYGDISVSGDFDEQTLYAMEYYVNQISETDAFVGELISALEALGENTVVVFFGDHQPSLDLTGDSVESGSIYTTEYVIWSNCGITAENTDLSSYSLGAYVLELIGERGGIISMLHTAKRGEENYTEYIENVAYDLLFGEMYAYGGAFPYKVPEITYGWQEIRADTSYIKNGTLYVIGNGFTESSVVYVDGKKRETIYISDTLIVAVDVNSAENITIAQVSDSGVIFSEVPCELDSEPEWDFEITGGDLR